MRTRERRTTAVWLPTGAPAQHRYTRWGPNPQDRQLPEVNRNEPEGNLKYDAGPPAWRKLNLPNSV